MELNNSYTQALNVFIVELNKTTEYTYDKLSRLTQESITDTENGDYQATYNYDEVSNRIQSVIDGVTTQYSYNQNDQLTQQGGTTYTYDKRGNTLTETLDGKTTTYSYNSRNQLIKREDADHTTTYSYNSKGIRTAKTVDNKTTNYLVDSNQAYAQVVQESQEGTTTVNYTYGNDLISQRRETKSTTYHYDGLGSARYLSDSSGAFTDSYDYEAFGKLLNQEGNTTNAYRYTGEQQDEESKQYYLRARYYAPTTGRFTQMDSYMGNSQDPITLHKYLYANANPQTYTDPTGYFGMADHIAAMNIKSVLENGQMEGYTKSVEIMMGLLNNGTYDASDGLSGVVGLGATSLGLNLMLRFSSKLQKARKLCKNSFTSETLISTKDGLVPIEKIKIGDEVWAYNEANQSKSLQKVTHVISRGKSLKNLVDIELANGEIITATDNHPLWTVDKQDWFRADELNINSLLLDINEQNLSIEELKSYKKDTIVYNLSIENDHTFYVGRSGVLGHNCDIDEIMQKLVKKVPDDYCEDFECKNFAKSLKKILKNEKIPYEEFKYQSVRGIWSLDKGKNIADEINGFHVGIKVGDKIYDNNNRYGISHYEWDVDLGLTEQSIPRIK